MPHPSARAASEAPDSMGATIDRLCFPTVEEAACVSATFSNLPVTPWSKKCGSLFLAAASVAPNPNKTDTPVTPVRNAAAMNQTFISLSLSVFSS